MSQYAVDDDLALRVEQLAKKKPFENLNFNDALRRIVEELQTLKAGQEESRKKLQLDFSKVKLPPAPTGAQSPKKATSPQPSDWLAKVPELKNKPGLGTWKAICDYLAIETAGDSARRRLKKWVATNRPDWPVVPEV